MRFVELIIEGYKEAQKDFEQVEDPVIVADTIQTYKNLVNKNQFSGVEKNIDYWRKQGWSNFYKTVVAKSRRPTTSQVKRNKQSGESVTIHEDEDWLIVIPLDKAASCFHGKDTAWCTTKSSTSYFEEYFYDKNVVLVYLLNKVSGLKWAIAFHEKVDKLELFDIDDNSIDSSTFEKQTGFDPSRIVDIVKQQHLSQI